MEKLKCICNKIIPLVYEESLSYYELLCKVIEKVNIIIDFYNMYSDEWQEYMNQVITETLTEWLEDGTFDGMVDRILGGLSDLVYINAWGAKGDGVTDDTAAIQEAIDNNPHAIFIFHGVYKITDTINLSFGSQTLLLSDIRYQGPTGKPAFKLNNNYYPVNSFGGGPLILGGCISGISPDNTSMDCGIQCVTTSARISNVHIRNYNKYGILLSDNFDDPRELIGSNRTGSAMIDNCVITNFPYCRGTGICIRYTDIKISNCNINGALHGIDYFGGNLFLNNTHITPTTYLTMTPGSCCIYVYPETVGGNMTLNLTGDYFNGVPESIIKVEDGAATGHVLNMSGCAMIMGLPDSGDRIYLMKCSNARMQYIINDLTIRAMPETRIFMYPKYTGSHKNSNCKLSTIDLGSNVPLYPWDIRYQSLIEKAHLINSSTYRVDSGKMLRVAGLFAPVQSGTLQKFLFNAGSRRVAEFYITYNDTDVYVHGSKYGDFGDIKLLVGRLQTLNIDGQDWYVRYIYLGNAGEDAFDGTPMYISCVDDRNDTEHRVGIFKAAASTRDSFTLDIQGGLYNILDNLTQG